MTTPRRPADAWRGWVAIRPGRFYFCGRIGAAGLHSHHAVQLIAGDGLVLCGADGREHAVEAAVVPANTPHAIVRGTDRGWLALVDPAQAGRRWRRCRPGRR